MKTNFLLLALCSILFVSCNERSNEVINVPDIKTSIYGHVNSDNYYSIANAKITTSPGSAAVVTDKNGDYLISDPQEGAYTVYIHAAGYANDSVNIFVSKGKETEASFKLKEFKDVPSPEKPYLKAPMQGSEISAHNTILEWRADSKISEIQYDVYFDTDPACKTLKFPNVGYNYLNVYGLESGKDYYWKVVAKSQDGQTNDGGVWSFHVK